MIFIIARSLSAIRGNAATSNPYNGEKVGFGSDRREIFIAYAQTNLRTHLIPSLTYQRIDLKSIAYRKKLTFHTVIEELRKNNGII